MASGDGLRDLGDLIDRFESNELRVEAVRPTDGDLIGDDDVSVRITASIELLRTITEDSDVANGVELCGEVPTCTFEVRIPAGDETVGAECDRPESVTEQPLELATQGDERATPTRPADVSDEVPYYENTDRLARVYAEHDTFAAMTEALGVDVSPATVRHHMVKRGIHPDSSADEDADRAADDAAVTSQDPPESLQSAKADGMGLPEEITLEQLVETVVETKTFYEARTALGIDAETARETFVELNLLDLVTSRLATKDERTVTETAVYERIHTS